MWELGNGEGEKKDANKGLWCEGKCTSKLGKLVRRNGSLKLKHIQQKDFGYLHCL